MTGPQPDRLNWDDKALEDGRGYLLTGIGAVVAVVAAAAATVAGFTGWPGPGYGYLVITAAAACYAGIMVAWGGWADVRSARRHRAVMDDHREAITAAFERLLGKED